MTNISKRFEQLVTKTYREFLEQGTILPSKSEKGIHVGDVLIQSDGPFKNILKRDKLIYKDISLNVIAIRIANLLAWNEDKALQDSLFAADLLYSRYYTDSNIFLDRYHRACNSCDEVKAEVMWCRYEDAKYKAINAKSEAERLAAF
jgi:hypothetical protein|tara:strand:- start:5071 stop:5511 length:441 start_codon:yes stop_codon:yes gene_type:complete